MVWNLPPGVTVADIERAAQCCECWCEDVDCDCDPDFCESCFCEDPDLFDESDADHKEDV